MASSPPIDFLRHCRECKGMIRSSSPSNCPLCPEIISSPFSMIKSAWFENRVSYGEFFYVQSESDFFVNLEKYGLRSIPVQDEGTYIHPTSLQSYLRAARQIDKAASFMKERVPDQLPNPEFHQLKIESDCNATAFRGRLITKSDPNDEERTAIRKRFELPGESLESSLNPKQFRIDMYFRD